MADETPWGTKQDWREAVFPPSWDEAAGSPPTPSPERFPKVVLRSLEPMLRRFCAKVWTGRGRRRGSGRVAPDLPGGAGRDAILAARLVDVVLGANVEILEAALRPAQGPIGPQGRALLNEHPVLAAAFDAGVDSVLSLGRLTEPEREDIRLQLAGLGPKTIAHLNDRALGTVKSQLARANRKLQELPGALTRVCPVCGVPIAGRKSKMFCSPACRKRAGRVRLGA